MNRTSNPPPFQGTPSDENEVGTGSTRSRTAWKPSLPFCFQGNRSFISAAQTAILCACSTVFLAAQEPNLWTLQGTPTRITQPEYLWEQVGYWVNEGPAALIRNGRIFLSYSASTPDFREPGADHAQR